MQSRLDALRWSRQWLRQSPLPLFSLQNTALINLLFVQILEMDSRTGKYSRILRGHTGVCFWMNVGAKQRLARLVIKALFPSIDRDDENYNFIALALADKEVMDSLRPCRSNRGNLGGSGTGLFRRGGWEGAGVGCQSWQVRHLRKTIN